MSEEKEIFKKAYNYCIYLLSQRDYSERKLRLKLETKEYTHETIEEVITKLHQHKYIQEEEYARARIRALIHKGYSLYYISQKLAQERLEVENEVIQTLFDELGMTEEDQRQLLIQKKLRGLNPNDQKTKDKIMRYLISKGHRPNYSELAF